MRERGKYKKREEEYIDLVKRYFKSFGFESRKLLKALIKGPRITSFQKFADFYPINFKREKTAEEIAESYNVSPRDLYKNVKKVLSIVTVFCPDFVIIYEERQNQINKNESDKKKELEEFYGTSDICLIKKILYLFDYKAAGALLLYHPLVKEKGVAIDQISSYINLTKPETREFFEEKSEEFKARLEDLIMSSELTEMVQEKISKMENPLDKRILNLIFAMSDGRRYSVKDISVKLQIDVEYIKDVLVEFSNKLHNPEEKSHNL